MLRREFSVTLQNQKRISFIALIIVWIFAFTSQSSFSQTTSSSGSLTFRAYIDGVDEVHIQGGQLWYEHLMWSKPGQTVVNGKEWNPAWTNDETSSPLTLDLPFPHTNGYFYKITQKIGRGDVTLTTSPHQGNGYEAIVVLDDGPQGGADWYEFTLSWKYTPFPDSPHFDAPYVIVDVLLPEFGDGFLTLTHDSGTITSNQYPDDVEIVNIEYSEPLPNYPVDLSLTTSHTNLDVIFKEQPRSYNDYTATIILDKDWPYPARNFSLMFTWGNRSEEKPTPTPWPTPSTAAPTPTPQLGPPKTLWVVNNSAFPELNEYSSCFEGFIIFAKSFQQFGAQNDAVIASSTDITDELLQQYQCVLFGDENRDLLSFDEAKAIERYVASGGSLFVCANQYEEYVLGTSAKFANSIVRPFGIEFGAKLFIDYGDHIVKFAEHPLTNDVDALSYETGSELSVRSPAEALAWNRSNKAALAAAEWGYGRVVALGSSAAIQDSYGFLEDVQNPDEYMNVVKPLCSGGSVEYGGNKQLTQNIARWMLRMEDVPLPTPTPAPANSIIISISTNSRRVLRGLEFTVQIKDGAVSVPDAYIWGEETLDIQATMNQPLPEFPIQLEAFALKGDADSIYVNDYNESNDFTATIVIKPYRNNSGRFEILVTWGELSPIPTPWPTWDPTEPTPTPRDEQLKVLWIIKHGALESFDSYFNDNFIQFREMFTNAGAASDVLIAGEQPITDSLFVGYDAVVFGDTRTVDPLNADEQQSVLRYVRGGGTILVLGNQDSRYRIEPSALYASSITEPFGVKYSTTVSGNATQFSVHPVTNRVSTIEITGGAMLEVTAPAQTIASTSNDDAVLASAVDGYGRVIAFGDEVAFFTPGSAFVGLGSSSHKQLAENIILWLLRKDDQIVSPFATPTPTPTFVPVSIEYAEQLLAHALEKSQPWLNPRPIQATYRMKELGPYQVEGGGSNPLRVGSIIQTPLHVLLTLESDKYEIISAGETWNNEAPIVAIDVLCDGMQREAIGFGGQAEVNYSSLSRSIRSFRIHLNQESLAPAFIEVGISPEPFFDRDFSSRWSFGPDFYVIDDGIAPKLVTYENSDMTEWHQFQSIQGVWIFDRGESHYPKLNLGVSAKMTDLIIQDRNDSVETQISGWPLY